MPFLVQSTYCAIYYILVTCRFFQPGSATDNRREQVNVETAYASEKKSSINKSSKSHKKYVLSHWWMCIDMKKDVLHTHNSSSMFMYLFSRRAYIYKVHITIQNLVCNAIIKQKAKIELLMYKAETYML